MSDSGNKSMNGSEQVSNVGEPRVVEYNLDDLLETERGKFKNLHQKGDLFGPQNVRNLVVLLLVGGIGFVGVREFMRLSTLDDRTSATNKVEILNYDDQAAGVQVAVVGIDEGQRLKIGQVYKVSAAVRAGLTGIKVRFFVDGELACEAIEPPYSCGITLGGEDGEKHEVRVELENGVGVTGGDVVRVVGVE